MKFHQRKHQDGLSLIETMMALGITTMLLAVAVVLTNMFQSQFIKSQVRTAVYEITQGISIKMSNHDVCSGNFYLKTLTTTTPLDIPALNSYTAIPGNPPTYTLVDNIITAGAAKNGITISSVSLVPQGNISQELNAVVRAANIHITYALANGVVQDANIPIFLHVYPLTNAIFDCAAPDGVVSGSLICQIEGQVYNPADGSCNLPPENWYTTGDPTSVTCPTGQFPTPFIAKDTDRCKCIPPGGGTSFNDPHAGQFTTNRQYVSPSAESLSQVTPPFVSDFNSHTQSCECGYATDLGSSAGWQAAIDCL